MTDMGKNGTWRPFYRALDAKVLMYGAAAEAAAMFARGY
jgi:hypothetical protein